MLIEESIAGWKEFELEVMRDGADNAVIVCSIENLDPMGVHTGDSITVAPQQTLSDREYQRMRDAAIEVLRVIGVETGGSNVQFAVDPSTGRQVLIEMNPRVSRSSALASKATGFPIAKIAALVAVGYRLDEITNDITGETPAAFEPTLDYVVVKIPRFAFEKFPAADTRAGLDDEVPSARSWRSGARSRRRSARPGAGSSDRQRIERGGRGSRFPDAPGDPSRPTSPGPPRPAARWSPRCSHRATTIDAVAAASRIDPWFVDQIAAGGRGRVRAHRDGRSTRCGTDELRHAKRLGLSDERIAELTDRSAASRAARTARPSA